MRRHTRLCYASADPARDPACVCIVYAVLVIIDASVVIGNDPRHKATYLIHLAFASRSSLCCREVLEVQPRGCRKAMQSVGLTMAQAQNISVEERDGRILMEQGHFVHDATWCGAELQVSVRSRTRRHYYVRIQRVHKNTLHGENEDSQTNFPTAVCYTFAPKRQLTVAI